MVTQFEAVGGVLLAIGEGVSPDQLSIVEDGLLLAWLATAKTPALALADTLGRIGWTQTASDIGSETLAVSQGGARMLDLAMPVAASGELQGRLAAITPDAVIRAWWDVASDAGLFAFATVASDGTLRLASFAVTWPSERVRLFARQDDATLARTIVTSTLNPAVYATVADAVATKIAAYRNQIVKS